jgi:hypothetical protein
VWQARDLRRCACIKKARLTSSGQSSQPALESGVW